MTPKIIPLGQVRYHWPIYFFVLPSLLVIGLFQYYPAFTGVMHSFFRWNGADINEYEGVGNYTSLLTSREFWASFRVALTIGVWNIAKMVPAIAVAVCIHRARSLRLQFFYRILFVAPMVIPGIIIMLIWRSFFFEANTGYLNRALFSTRAFDLLVWCDQAFHWGGVFVDGRRPAWLGDSNLILFAVIVWGFPWVASFAVLTHLAKLQGIPRELYEAADLDGASWWTRFTKLELPMLAGSINILMVLVIIETIKDAGMILALVGMGGGPGGCVTVPALFMLRQAFINQQMGAACAVGVVLTLIVMFLKWLMDGVADWTALTRGQKRRARVVGSVIAVALYGFMLYSDGAWPGFVKAYGATDFSHFGNAVASLAQGRGSFFIFNAALPTVILAMFIPWPSLFAYLGRMRKTAPKLANAWTVTPRQERAIARFSVRQQSAVHQFKERLRNVMLRITKHGFIWFILAFAYLPLYLMVIVSVKDNNQFYEKPAVVTTPLHMENWQAAADAVLPSLANSIFITTTSTAFTLFLALGAAYFFARVRVPGSRFLWNALLILMMMPTIANLVPLFKLLINLNLQNTLSALIIVGAAGGEVFAIFVLRNFVADLPQDLFEAAEIDGASHLRQMLTIVAPLSGPILGVIGLMHAVGQWNDFILPLILMRDHSRLPVMVQLLRMAGEYIKLWGPLMAGYALASIPVIVLFIMCMRLFTRGLTEGAVKG